MQATPTQQSQSIYARPLGRLERAALARRRARELERQASAPCGRPPCRQQPGEGWPDILSGSPARLAELESEVRALEAWVARRPEAARGDGPTVRRALDHLRRFGRLAAAPLPDVEPETRLLLVRLLALELRWCYAAAGTDRDCFERAIGRTGAR